MEAPNTGQGRTGETRNMPILNRTADALAYMQWLIGEVAPPQQDYIFKLCSRENENTYFIRNSEKFTTDFIQKI